MVRRISDSNSNGERAEPVLGPEEALRYQIFALLNASETSGEQDLKVLQQCASHIQDKFLVEQIARACKMKLSDFECGKDLELYYNVKRGAQERWAIPARDGKIPDFGLATLLKWQRTGRQNARPPLLKSASSAPSTESA